MASIIVYAVIAGIGIVLVSAPLGCFVIWRRMSYFGDTLSHSALLGASLGIIFKINVTIAIFSSLLLISYLLLRLQKSSFATKDTLLGILAHSSLAIGYIVINISNVRTDIMSYLFGDILAIGNTDIALIYGCSLVTLVILYLLWRPLLEATIHTELAKINGVNTDKMELIITLLTAMVIACNIKIVGVLLITSMLIIPAALSQLFAKTPEQMVVIAALFGFLSVILGLLLSFVIDSPTGPSIVTSGFILFLIARLFKVTINDKTNMLANFDSK